MCISQKTYWVPVSRESPLIFRPYDYILFVKFKNTDGFFTKLKTI